MSNIEAAGQNPEAGADMGTFSGGTRGKARIHHRGTEKDA
jgi:hypothetical protein